MSGAGFKTFVAGDVFTAADANDYFMKQSVMVFTNEAARDAAITSPSEGMIAYLTAPTLPAATGGSTFIPSGIQTIYNGSVWVCVTQLGAFTVDAGTTTSGSYTATLSGSPGTNPSVTLVTGTTAVVSITVLASNTTGFATGRTSVAVSGAGTVGANDNWAARDDNNNVTSTVSSTAIVSGLTAGTNTFTLQYASSGGVTYQVSLRRLVVQGIA
jgi:hypothetical protein